MLEQEVLVCRWSLQSHPKPDPGNAAQSHFTKRMERAEAELNRLQSTGYEVLSIGAVGIGRWSEIDVLSCVDENSAVARVMAKPRDF